MAAQDAQPSSFHWHYPDLEDKNFTLHGTTSIVVLVVILTLLLFITISCIYIRRARSDSTDDHGSDSGGPKPVGPLGLDPKAISSLPVVLHKPSNDSDAKESEPTCSICLSDFGEGEKVKMLPNCRHGFHPDCIDEWLRKQRNCPFCRTPAFNKTEVDHSVV